MKSTHSTQQEPFRFDFDEFSIRLFIGTGLLGIAFFLGIIAIKLSIR